MCNDEWRRVDGWRRNLHHGLQEHNAAINQLVEEE
ncbi:MAG: hypothetical protein ACJAWM_000808 [Sulfitobacter sp.]|jgi:hypothetical protein